MEVLAIALSIVATLVALLSGYAWWRARMRIRSLRVGLTRLSDQNNKLAVTAKDLEGRMRFVEESLAELGTTTEDLKGRLRPVEQSLQPVPSLMGRLTNDQERLLDRIRTVEAARTSLRRDLMSLTETVDRLSHETDTFVRWTRELGADAKRRSALPKGPKPELQLREALEAIARGNAR